MYGIQTIQPGLVQIALPPHSDVGLPFGTPYNVYLLDGPSPTVVDTGHASGRAGLLAALEACGTDPARVGRVVLTSARPDAIGNVPLFSNATVVAASAPASYAAHALESLTPTLAIARELVGGPEGNPDWSVELVDRFEGLVLEGIPEFRPLVVDDGQVLVTGRGPLSVQHTPGADLYAACYVDHARNQLFSGPTVVPPSTVRILSPKSYGISLQAISALEPEMIFSAHGPVQTSFYAIFRSLNLSVSNLVQNMPFALQGPTPVARIAYNDVGYWPRDLIRFAASVHRFKVMLDELVASGVASVTGTGAWAEYSMERPSRY